MTDHDAIRNLVARYSHLLDAGDFAGVAGLFTVDGVFEVLGGVHRGREGIVAMFRGFFDEGGAPVGKHIAVNTVIDVDGDGAEARSDWLFIAPGEAGPWSVFAAGHYDDTFVRVAGAWRFARRIDTIDGDPSMVSLIHND